MRGSSPPSTPSVRLVFTVEDDRATGLTLYQGGGVFEGDRQP